ncbi:MAG: hypothetical protein IIY21_14605 [Clostridiales bacterium]|nr:hypothetical protein [Clostridiales bacterium]
MTIEEILKLGAMGYTKDDIEAMSSDNKGEPEKKEPEPEKKEPEPEKKEPEQEPQKADPTKDLLQFMAGEFEKLNRSIQSVNILGSNINQPKEKTAEDVLAELIAPPQKKGGK